MKNIILKLTLISILVIACNNAIAVFTDNTNLQLLMHCDVTNEPWWITSPDDNSSGRSANEPILNKTNAAAFTKDFATQPTLMPGSPKGGSYFSFDGVNDTIYVNPGWAGGTNVVCDFSLRWLSLPPPAEYSALVQTVPWRSFLQSDARISFLMGGSWLISTVALTSNTWYDVSFSIINDEAEITVDGTTDTATISLADSSVQIMIGYDIFSLDRFFYGDLDEIRVGNIPEPVSLILIGLLGFLAIRK